MLQQNIASTSDIFPLWLSRICCLGYLHAASIRYPEHPFSTLSSYAHVRGVNHQLAYLKIVRVHYRASQVLSPTTSHTLSSLALPCIANINFLSSSTFINMVKSTTKLQVDDFGSTSKQLEIVDKLRELGVGDEISLPQVSRDASWA